MKEVLSHSSVFLRPYKLTVKKIISLFLTTAFLLSCFLCLTSCHTQKITDAFTVPDTFDTNQNYDIVFWAKNDTNKNQVDVYKKAVSDFEAVYPNIHVTLRLYTDYNKIYQDVITNISTKTTPNICISYPDHIATYLTSPNTVVPLDDLMSHPLYGLGGSEIKFDSPSKSQMVDKFVGECQINGVTYAMPFVRSTEALYINKTYVEKLGYSVPDTVTWEWIWEVSDAATAKNDDGTYAVNGQNIMIPFIYKSTDNMMIQMLRQSGAPYTTADGTVTMFSEQTADILNTVYRHSLNGAFSTFKISSYPANFLNAGQCIFAVDSTAGSTWMGSEAPLSDISKDSFVEFETVVRPIPQISDEADRTVMISQGPSLCVFNSDDSGKVMASWLFVQYLLTNQVQISYAQTEGYIPVTTSALEDPVYLDYLNSETNDSFYYKVKLDASKLLLGHIDDTFTTPVFNGSASVREAAGQLIEKVAYAPRRKITVDDVYIESCYKDVIAQYHLDSFGNQNAGDITEKPLPVESLVLLITLGVCWTGLLSYFIYKYIKKKKHPV